MAHVADTLALGFPPPTVPWGRQDRDPWITGFGEGSRIRLDTWTGWARSVPRAERLRRGRFR
eukprot:5223820-Pleurochrysis_carterae.AAC.1